MTRFLHDLFSPRGTVRRTPPPARSVEQAGKEILIRSVLSQMLSGPDTTLAEKAAWVAGPEVVGYVAHRGAWKGVESHATGRRPSPPSGNGRTGDGHRAGPFGDVIDV